MRSFWVCIFTQIMIIDYNPAIKPVGQREWTPTKVRVVFWISSLKLNLVLLPERGYWCS